MAAGTPLSQTDAAAARRAAAAILHESQFHAPSVPRPLHGVLTTIGNALSSVGDAIGHAVDSVGRDVPGGTVAVWCLLALLVIVAVVVFARRAGTRLDGGSGVMRSGAPQAVERPEALERRADVAEREGRFDEAVRLRFRAGLQRLAARDEIAAVSSTPTAKLARIVASSDFDGLARRFDEITYGADPATADDAQAARQGWRVVLDSAPVRG